MSTLDLFKRRPGNETAGNRVEANEARRMIFNPPPAPRRAEQLSASQCDHVYRSMLDSVTAEGALMLSQDGIVLYCNPAFARMVGRSVDELIGVRFGAWVSEAHRTCFETLLAGTAPRSQVELEIARADGTAVPVRLRMSPLAVAEAPTAICLLVLDLTESRLLRQLEKSDALKTRFLYQISHEFRSPLNSIFALTTLLLRRADGALNRQQDESVGFIRKAADSLLALADDLFDFAKIESGKLDVRAACFEAADLLNNLRGMLPAPLLTPAVSLVFEKPAGIPALYSDEGKVTQILRNFINNALTFTERGEVRVAAGYDSVEDAVIFSVRDSGIGLAPADQERIFEEFTQLESSAQIRGKGAGLGLMLCRKLAALLGGRLMVESEPGIGSTFSLVLPRCYAPATQASSGLAPVRRVNSRDERGEGARI